MRKGIATVSLSGVLQDTLGAAAGAGFDAIELFDNDLIGSPLAPREVASRCADLGLEIALFQPIRDVEGVPPDAFETVLHRLRTKLGVMAELGTTTLLACSNASAGAVDDLDLTAEQLHRVGEVSAEAGVTVAFEALAWGRHVHRLAQAWEAVVRADHPAITLAVDTFHVLARGDDGSALDGIPGDRIGFLQVADAPWLDMNLLEWSRHHRCFPGQGTLDVTGVVAATLAAGYRGPLSLEVFSDVVRETDPDVTARDAMRSLVFLEDELARVVPPIEGATVSAAPAVATRTDAAFLELACTPGDDHVDKLLDALGFALAGRHRSKPVAWWRNGEAHVVVNEAAGESDTNHASALGLAARPVEAVAARARALLWPEVDSTRGTGEAMLPGIASPSGLHVFVSDTPGHGDHWQGDFVPTSAGGAGFSTGLDHVVISVSPLQLNEEMAFFRTVFGFAPESPEEFMEPHGRLRSIALRPTAGDVRIVLNVTEASPQSAHPHGVTQVALRCDDVATAVASLRSRGVPLMRVPDNYYADLDARFGLPTEVLDHLREHQLLYDRVGDAELLHAFTEDLGTGFHVELLERRGGYDGYGSPNTFVRLVSQLGGNP
ncbi:sugar phosphate isomerase/epimerase and 4-hydroxyphenylpyruvate domain-containing protein [Marmoricola sp. URHB0036]|uniref:sugar phosphate isomerase/epimerase and 4-hydroxyphenylpyruvate domain-containing protein n=1 Tax=Marmoricola sp. URHB0036 TaxID=1298863 RepID=UPI00041D6F55|nr:sugar phosphate isomerase/epimerase and 4-hydroxyphenylpyruvate domain-containing protein [Marmoricola sp. URHB0036]